MKTMRTTTVFRTLLVIAAACVLPLFCSAQAASAGSRLPGQSNVDIFGGYTYLHPVNSDIYSQEYTPIPAGFTTSITGYFTRSFGLQAEYSKSFNSPDYCFSTVQGGPAFRYQIGRLIPFAHVIGGGAQVGPSYDHAGNVCSWGWAVNSGIGVDYVLPAPALHNRLAIRPIEADFQFSNVDYGPQSPGRLSGGDGQISAYRLSAGFVIRLGEMTPPLPASFGCEVQPVTVYPGDPITVTGSTLNLEQSKKLTPTYTWTTTGGKLSRSDAGATIATNGLAPGDYTVVGKVSEGSKPTQHAECSASFRVSAYEPPTISCSSNPTSIQPGGFATITSVGKSPQNRQLSYSYGASAGQITGTGPTGTLSAADVPPGSINITCNVVDDLGKSASAATTVAVVASPAPPPPAPLAQNLCSISFERDRKRPVRVDNEAKGCLDDIALELNRETDSVLVVVGKHDPTEKPDAAAERTLNVKQYLTDEKGIDPNRIEVRTGETAGRTVDNVLVPPGATWDTGSTTSFDPTRVSRHGQPYAPQPKK
jgi:hypothetical protein